MKKTISILLAIAICVSCIAMMTLSASAATCSSGTSTQTITVTTKSAYYYPGSSSITLSQTKGVVTYDKTRWGRVVGTGTAKYYGTWNISVYATDGSDSFSKTLSGSSVKISLKPNKTYKITVTYNWYVDTIIMIDHVNSRWTKYPSWRVSSTWKVSDYS